MNLANWLSLVRIILIPFFISAIAYYRSDKDFLRYIALGIFMLAVISDWVDGYIARSKKLKTKIGSILDPIADKLLLSSSFIILALAHDFPANIRLPLWLPILIISRDIILVLGSVLTYMITTKINIIPSLLGKLTTFFQMGTIICVLLQFSFSALIWHTAAFFTVISGIDYILKGAKFLGTNNNHIKIKS